MAVRGGPREAANAALHGPFQEKFAGFKQLFEVGWEDAKKLDEELLSLRKENHES